MLLKNKKVNKKSIIINAIIILLVAGFTVFYLAKNNIITAQSLSQVGVWQYLALFMLFMFTFCIVSLIDFLVYRKFSKRMNYGRCFVNTLCGNLGSNVTPFRSAHFPMMLYYQSRVGIPLTTSAVALIKCQIIYSITSIIVYMVVAIVLAIMNVTIVFYNVTVALWLVACVGLAFHGAVFVIVVLLAFSKRVQRSFINSTTSIYKKFSKKFNAQEYRAETLAQLEIYREQLLEIIKRAHRYLPHCLMYVVYLILQGSIQYFAYLLLTNAHFDISMLAKFYTLNLTSTYITNVIPLPGGTGTAEVLFSMVFVSVIPDVMMGATIILWRVATYYVPIIIEFIVFTIACIKKKATKQTFKELNESNEIETQ